MINELVMNSNGLSFVGELYELRYYYLWVFGYSSKMFVGYTTLDDWFGGFY